MMTALFVALLAQQAPAWTDVQAIFAKHCNACHDAKESKGDLVLTSYASALKGGESGPAWVPAKPAESLLVALVDHAKKPFMPPPKKGDKLKPADIDLLRAWIAAGAPGPREGETAGAVVLPKIAPKVAPRRAVNALAWVPSSKSIAVARLGEVEILDGASRALVRRLTGHAGPVNDLAVAPDGAWIAAAGGVPGASGEVRLWSLKDGRPIRTLAGHADAIYALAVSPDGRLLATGSYDRDILLWDVAGGKLLRTLGGHNEAVFDVAFRPDGRILASASADRTVKLWDVASGERRDTLTEATKALHAVAWTPDGRHVLAGGVDNRIRAWEVSAEAKEGTNPIRASVFAHEGSLLAIRVSRDGQRVLSTADDRTVKLFGPAPALEPQRVLEPQPDWPAAAAFVSDDAAVAVGRLDGTLAVYEAATGKTVAAPKPEPSGAWPRGVERGTGVEVRVSGKNLHGITAARVSRKDVHVEVLKSAADAVWVSVTAEPDAEPGPVDLWVGDAGPVKVWVDDLRQIVERESGEAVLLPVPSSVWGTLSSPGDTDLYTLDLRKGDVLVLDLAAKRMGSKLEAVVTLSDASGRLLASNIDYEGDADPFLAFPVPSDGRYVVRVGDLQYGFSEEHVYRLSVGPLAVVTGFAPLSVPAHAESEVVLIGHNLPADARARVKAGAPGEAAVPIDLSRLRVRKTLKVAVAAAPEPAEAEPNDRPSDARDLAAPGGANGVIGAPGDVDLWRFQAKKGQRWVVETDAARRGSPVDTKIEILHADGRPVERVLLRAVRDSYLTFRPIDANAIGGRFWQWEEMDLDQYLYLQGEVVKLFLAPRGPDSQWDFFSLGGKRVTYFDTSATAHALDEPAYIVEPHPPGTKLPANGLPSFTLTYANDDDSLRRLGSDSCLHFTAPADGAYLVRVTDVRDQGGERHAYRLVIRETRPDFSVRLEGQAASVPAGSGKDFTVRVDRIDGFEGPVRVEVAGAPPGFAVTSPIQVDAGHFFEKGTLWAAADAVKPSGKPEITLTARATIDGREVVKTVKGFGTPSVAAAPKVRVHLEPVDGATSISVEPGKETAALLRIERNGFDERVTFDVEGLPFGVIVSDIGLNGVLIPEKGTERRIFLQCAPWVEAQTRLCHARAREVGNPTSPPVPFTVRERKASR